MARLDETPRANRVHIAFFGKTNAGKSSVINQICGSQIALVSDVAGTTTDPVYKSMELPPVGPVVFIDTAGLDDNTELGKARIKKSKEVGQKADIAIFVVRADDTDIALEQHYAKELAKKNTPVIFAFNQFDEEEPKEHSISNRVVVNAKTGRGIDALKQMIARCYRQEEEATLVGDLVRKGDLVLLVAPQDIQAPKGRLILPQVQVIRDLLDHGCKVSVVLKEDLPDMLDELKNPPKLVITDSQVFGYVNEVLPKEIPLTSFSILMSKAKGDIRAFMEGARAIASLKPGDKVLIAESCTHHAQKGDIAREKLPSWLESYVGGALKFSNSAGHELPEEIGEYKIIIHCGACMINRKNMLSKIEKTKRAEVPITNFGVAIAFLNDMLERVVY